MLSYFTKIQLKRYPAYSKRNPYSLIKLMQNYFQILKFHAPQIDAELRFGLIVDQTKQF